MTPSFRLLVLLIAAALAALFVSAESAPLRSAQRAVLDLDASHQPVLLRDWADGFLDVTGKRMLEDVISSAPFERTESANFKLKRGQTQWLRFAVPPAPDAERWYLELPVSQLDRISLYVMDASGRWNSQSAGDSIPVELWPVPARHPLLPIVVSAEYPVQHVLAIESNVSVRSGIRFVTEGYLSAKEQRAALVLGGFFGLCLILLTYAVLSAVALRDWNYGAFSAYVLAILVWQAGATGIGAFVLWPGVTNWADVAPMVGALLSIPPLCFVLVRVTGFGDRVPVWDRAWWLLLGVIGAAILALALPGAQTHVRDGMMPALGLAVTVPLLWACVQALLGADRVAPWLVAAVLPSLAMAWVDMSASQGLMPESWIAQHGMRLALMWQLPMMLVALALRTQERRAVRQRIADLGIVDGNTGLVSQEVLLYRANLAILRTRRLGSEAGLIRIDLDSGDALGKPMDKRLFARLQLRYADRLLRLVRDIDTVASMGDGCYAILVDGPAPADVVRELAVRSVAASLHPFAKLALAAPPRVRVHFSCLPRGEVDAQAALNLLANAFAVCDPLDTRAVFELDAEQPSRPVDQWGQTENPLGAPDSRV